jgi:hypothetical protein
VNHRFISPPSTQRRNCGQEKEGELEERESEQRKIGKEK